MKTLTTLTAALLTFFSFSAFASDDVNAEKTKIDQTVNSYIAAVAQGKIKPLQDLFEANTKFTYNLGDRVLTYGKAELLAHLKTNTENVEQNCRTDYSIVEYTPSQAIIKVNLLYDKFTKTDIINVAKTIKGWKITNVSSSFTDK